MVFRPFAACLLLSPLMAMGQNFVPATIAPADSASTQNNPTFTFADRWNHYLERTYSWQRMALLGLDTGTDMAFARPHNGRTANAFADRYTAAFIRRSTRTSIELLAGAALKEDIRRRSSGETAFGKRIKYALTHSFAAYAPDGHATPAWSRMIGAAGGIYTFSVYHNRPMTTGRMAHQLSWALASNVQDSLLNEFSPDMKRLGLRLRNRLMSKFSR